MAPTIIVILGTIFGVMALATVALGALFVVGKVFVVVGMVVVGVFRGAGMLLMHVGKSIHGIVLDTLRAAGSLITSVAMLPFSLLNVALGRWSAAGHFAKESGRELKAAGLGVYRAGVSHPMRLVGLGPVVDGIEKRLPQAVIDAPRRDLPKDGEVAFDGWKVLGSLPRGGSGAHLYLAEPVPEKLEQAAMSGARLPERVVIKAFSLDAGSTLPQIVRESRALEAARSLGLVLEHDLKPTRFHYVMPFVPGDDLGTVARDVHAASGPEGLSDAALRAVTGYGAGLLEILARFHAAGLWHKDIKPSNVIVSGERVELVDLGLVTPLASAMTLTTHGTEYYRDPELVRLAMQGVKVHEVDGVKFDLYSSGAVLYSLVEGDFPAHGNLSRLTKRCPDALRWVIRRSMADLKQRYKDAGEMLADLQVIVAAPDPFALRPADLPSMGGAPALAETRSTPPPLPAAALGASVASRAADAIGANARTFADKYRDAIGSSTRKLRKQAKSANVRLVADKVRTHSRAAKRRAAAEWDRMHASEVRRHPRKPRRRRHAIVGMGAIGALGLLGLVIAESESHGGRHRYEYNSSQSGVQTVFSAPDGTDWQASGHRVTIVPPTPSVATARSFAFTHAPAAPVAEKAEPAPLRALLMGQRPELRAEEARRVLRTLNEEIGLEVFSELDGATLELPGDTELVAKARSIVHNREPSDSRAYTQLSSLLTTQDNADLAIWYDEDECSGELRFRVVAPMKSRLDRELSSCLLDQDDAMKLLGRANRDFERVQEDTARKIRDAERVVKDLERRAADMRREASEREHEAKRLARARRDA